MVGSRTKRVGLAIGIAVTIVGMIVVLLASDPLDTASVPPVEHQRESAVHIPEDDVDDFVRRAASPVRARIEGKGPAGSSVLAEFETLGLLSSSEEASLLLRLRQTHTQFVQRLSKYRETADIASIRGRKKEAEYVKSEAEMAALIDIVEKRQYLTAKPGEFKGRLPGYSLYTLGAVKGGDVVQVIILVKVVDYPLLDGALRYLDATRQEELLSRIDNFNSKPESDRSRLVELWRSYGKDGSQLSPGEQIEARRDKDLARYLIPGNNMLRFNHGR